MLTTSYTLTATTAAPFEETVERVRGELANEGFGILSEIDVQATLREKLGVEEEPYLILGACNPPLAHRALSAEPDLGTLLPCNVVIYRADGETHVSAIDAEKRPRSSRTTISPWWPSKCARSSAQWLSAPPPNASTRGCRCSGAASPPIPRTDVLRNEKWEACRSFVVIPASRPSSPQLGPIPPRERVVSRRARTFYSAPATKR